MRRALPALALFFVGLVPVACDRGATRDEGLFRGVYVSPPMEKPDFTFTDASGQPFNFRQQTADKVALLFFGYTHCPDVCPLHAANVAAVLKQMPFEEREKVRFIFVTTDPERDTPERLKQWLGAFDSSFIGLAAPPGELARIQSELRIAPARKEIPPGGDSTNYLVGHAAQVIAFGLDGFARTEYPMGVRQEDWAKDLPRLARGEVPRDPGSNLPGAAVELAPTKEYVAGPVLRVEVAVMAAPPTVSEASVYLTIANGGSEDTLVTVWSPEAQHAMLHTTVSQGGQQVMQMVERAVVPAGGSLVMRPGGMHLMLTGLSRLPAAGDSFPLRLRFAKGGDLVIAPMVVPYAELEAALGPRP